MSAMENSLGASANSAEGEFASSARHPAAAAEANGSTTKENPKPLQKAPMLQLLNFTGKYRWATITGCVLSALHSVFDMLALVSIWFVLKTLLEVAPNWSDANNLATYAWWCMWLSIISSLLYFIALATTHLGAFRATSNIRKQTMGHIAKLPLGWFNTHSSGETRRIVDGAVEETHALMAHRLPDLSAALLTPIAFLVVSFSFDWRMGIACILPILVSGYCIASMMSTETGQHFMKLYQDALDAMNKAAVEYVRGIPVVKTFQQTVYSFKAFSKTIDDYRKMAYAYSLSCQPLQVTQLIAINGVFSVLVPMSIILASNMGDFKAFLTDFLFYSIFSLMVPSMMIKIMYTSQAFSQAYDAVHRMNSILDVDPLPQVTVGRGAVPDNSSIVFEHVNFHYGESTSKALDDVSFEVPAGSTVALVGPSGSGKTTAASLVPRFWDPDSGRVSIGGCDLRSIEEKTLMDQIAFVFQNDRLFSQSLLENIRFARPNATREEVMEAAHAAQCDDVLNKLPDGLDTVVGVGGVHLSGGERQRIALARAICKDAPIIVLDEATSFADPDNEARIQKAFEQLASGKTVLMIAHRLSTVRNADKIIVLDSGHVVESGTHDELISKSGMYSNMWNEYKSSITWTVDNMARQVTREAATVQGTGNDSTQTVRTNGGGGDNSEQRAYGHAITTYETWVVKIQTVE